LNQKPARYNDGLYGTGHASKMISTLILDFLK